MAAHVSPGARAAFGCLVATGLVDVAVIAVTGDSITGASRRNPYVTAGAIAFFVAHLVRPPSMAWMDPLTMIGRLGNRYSRAPIQPAPEQLS